MKSIIKENWKSRKLWIFIVLMCIGSFIWSQADASVFNDWVDMSKWLFGIYASGNVGAKIGAAMNGKK